MIVISVTASNQPDSSTESDARTDRLGQETRDHVPEHREFPGFQGRVEEYKDYHSAETVSEARQLVSGRK